MAERIENLEAPDWFLQPGDRLASSLVDTLKKQRVFRLIFGESIVSYKRMDFSARELPALRIYNDTGRTDSDTWYLNGDLKLDVIFPANLRRAQAQQFPDLVVSTILAMFRSDKLLASMRLLVPGLNELGKVFSYDKSLGFIERDKEDICPLSQVTANFRILLEEWDRFLESDDRTSADPFEQTLGDLETLYLQIQAQNDAGEVVVTESITLNVKEE